MQVSCEWRAKPCCSPRAQHIPEAFGVGLIRKRRLPRSPRTSERQNQAPSPRLVVSRWPASRALPTHLLLLGGVDAQLLSRRRAAALLPFSRGLSATSGPALPVANLKWGASSRRLPAAVRPRIRARRGAFDDGLGALAVREQGRWRWPLALLIVLATNRLVGDRRSLAAGA